MSRRSVVDARLEMARVLSTKALERHTWQIAPAGGRPTLPLDLHVWRHDAFSDRTRPMEQHVVMAYARGDCEVARTEAGRTVRGLARPGRITTIPSGSEALWKVPEPLEAVHLYLHPRPLARFAASWVGRPLGDLVPRTGYADPVSSALLVELASAGDGLCDRMYTEQLIVTLLHRLARAHCTTDRLPAVRGGLTPRQVARVCERMRHDLRQDVSLAELSAEVGLSVFHFCRAFKVSTGLPPHRWRRRERLREGRRLLETSTLPIAEIASSVGYRDPSAFAAAFGREFHVTPSAVRRADDLRPGSEDE